MNYLELAREYEAKDLVRINKHPTLDLYILNYTPECQFSGAWDDFTIRARGLVVNGVGDIVAYTMPKFFNYEELIDSKYANSALRGFRKELLEKIKSNMPFVVTEKIDGSMIILFKHNDNLIFASRGSFNSDQSHWAEEVYEQWDVPDILVPVTFIFELIWPENQIVVNYGDRKDLVPIACFDNTTGEEISLDLTIFRPEFTTFDDILEYMKTHECNNEEGFVIRFQDGFRVKMKFAEYCRLHRILTGLNEKGIWEMMKDGTDFDKFLVNIPEEHTEWITTLRDELQTKFDSIEQAAKDYFEETKWELARLLDKPWNKIMEIPRKEWALKFITSRYKSILFCMLDGTEYKDIIWEMIKPKIINELPISNTEAAGQNS